MDLAAVLKPQPEVEDYFNRTSTTSEASCASLLPDRVLVFFDKATGDFSRMAKLSSDLGCAVVGLHIHDEDLWKYEFYVSGELQDRFNTRPSYWEEIQNEERAMWKGDAQVVASHWTGLDPESIRGYLIHHDLLPPEHSAKSYPDDVYEIGDCWQICDFLRKLGTPYPSE